MDKVLQCAQRWNCKESCLNAYTRSVLAVADIDMCRQGDVQIVASWKRSHTIQMLKREVEQKGYSGFTV